MARILYISEGYSTHDRRFLEKLAQTSHGIWFLPFRKDPVPLESRPFPEGIHALPALTAGEGKKNLWDWIRSWDRLRRHLRRIRPDIVHAGPVQSGGFVAAVCGADPLIVMSWGSDVLVAADQGLWNRWVTRFTLRRARMAVGDCNAVCERITALSGLGPDRIVQLPFGVDRERFSQQARPVGVRESLGWAGNPVLLSTRSFEPGLGIDLFLEAAGQVIRERPEVRVLMLGDGTLRRQATEKIRRDGLSGPIRILGRAANDAMPGYFREADLYISASISDGTSVSLLEAMASGLPVIVPDAHGNREWVTPGVHGWRYPVGDAQALSRCILEALGSPAGTKQAMGKANQALIAERADWDKNFERLLAGYDAVLANGNSRAKVRNGSV